MRWWYTKYLPTHTVLFKAVRQLLDVDLSDTTLGCLFFTMPLVNCRSRQSLLYNFVVTYVSLHAVFQYMLHLSFTYIVLIGQSVSLDRVGTYNKTTTICDSKKPQSIRIFGDYVFFFSPRRLILEMIIGSHSITIFCWWAPGLREGGCLFVPRDEHVFSVTSRHVIILFTMYWLIILYALHGNAWGHGLWSSHTGIVTQTHADCGCSIYIRSSLFFSFRLMFCFSLRKINMNWRPL